MNAIALKICKEDDTLLEPHLHDGMLLGIELPTKDSVELSVAELGGDRYRILLEGVLTFVATNFRSGNIILDVTISRGENAEMAALEPLVELDHDGVRPAKYVRQIYERILQDSLYVLELNPSYGCCLVAAAKSITIFRDK